MIFGSFGDLTSQQELDARLFKEAILRSVSESVLRTFCEACGGEFVKSPIAPMAFDIIGVRDFFCIEMVKAMRPAGILFRFFDSHAGRLAEFQLRLNAAKWRNHRVTR